MHAPADDTGGRPALLTIADVAMQLRVGQSTVRRLLDRRELAYLRISARCIRIDQAAVDAYLRERLEAPSSPGTSYIMLQSAGDAFIADARAARARRKSKRSKTGRNA